MAYCFPPTVHAKQVTMLPHLKYVRQFLAVTLHLHVRVCGREERVGGGGKQYLKILTGKFRILFFLLQ